MNYAQCTSTAGAIRCISKSPMHVFCHFAHIIINSKDIRVCWNELGELCNWESYRITLKGEPIMKEPLLDFDNAFMRECHNKRCPRKGTLVYTNNRYCSSCKAKLKQAFFDSNSSRRPIVDIGTDPRSVTDNHHRIPALGGAAMSPRKPYIETFSQFKGDLAAYRVYLKTFGIEEFLMYNDFKGGTWEDYNKYLITLGIGVGAHSSSRVHVMQPSSTDTFTCSNPDISGCPIVVKPTINLPTKMYHLWTHLAGHFSTEWIAYLMGNFDEETNSWTITDYYFPKQKAHGAHVDAEDGQIKEGTIGSVHSHVRMSAYFSQEDRKHFNHPVEMVINADGKVATCCRTTLKCGSFSRVEDVKVMLTGDEEQNAAAAALEAVLTPDSPHSTTPTSKTETTETTKVAPDNTRQYQEGWVG